MHMRGFGRQPALDGVRAVAVAVVLVFHLGASWLPGGYLGVSVCFTLSGFLITSLLLHEHAAGGRINVPAFYLRRTRRLLPGSMVCLAGVALLAMTGVLAERASLGSEMHAAILQFANWDALLEGRSYGGLFEAPSPVAHFWSLAIEEQFYLLWPLLMIALTGWAARRPDRPRAIVALTSLFVVLAVSAPLTARWWSPDAAYFASWARFAEIAAGAALAAVTLRRQVPARARFLAMPCLVAIVALCVVSPAGRGWAYQGGLPLFALLSAGLILGLQVDGPVRAALSIRPLVWLGKVSYGLYLFHWPLFAILDEQRTGLDGPTLAAVRLGASLAVAAISFQLVETPLRLGRLLPQTGRYLTGAVATALVVAMAATAVPEWERPSGGAETVVLGASVTNDQVPLAAPPVPGAGTELASAYRSPPAAAAPAAGQGPITAPADAPRPSSGAVAEGPAPTTTPPPPRPTTVAVFGDSVPDWLVRDAASSYARTDITVVDAAQEACDGAVDAPRLRRRDGKELFPPETCRPWTQSYRDVVEGELPVDTAVLVLGQAPLVDRLIGGLWLSPCVDMSWYRTDVEKRIRYLRGEVDHVVLALPSWGGKGATWMLADDHLVREACVRKELAALAERLRVPTVDLADLLCPDGPAGPCNDLRYRDGTHIDPEDAPKVLDWLLDEVLAVT